MRVNKTIVFLMALNGLIGCSTVAEQLDATWSDEEIEYTESHPMLPLEIPTELAHPETSQAD